MDQEMRDLGRSAVERLNAIIDAGHGVSHDEVREAMSCIIAFRNRAIAKHREGTLDRTCLDRANSALSLAYGTEFPLSGFHVHRLEQTRDAVKAMIEEHR